MPSILCINTGGIGDLHGLRMRRLTQDLDADCTYLDVDRSVSRLENGRKIWSTLQSRTWDLVYMESTGIAGGFPLIRAAHTWGQRYVVSSGDPVGGFFRVVKGPIHGFAFERYERHLYRKSAGFIGWTPYLAGAALKMGAPRAVTVEGAVDTSIFEARPDSERRAIKERYGLNTDHIVAGVVGSLKWTPRQSYCYGLELARMLPYVQRQDLSVLVVGDGDGREQIEAAVPAEWKDRVVFTGRVPETEVVDALNAMDIGFITQTMDELGSFRLTTKLPEYLAAGLPVAMSPIPGFFDYACDAGWALPPHHPASDAFVSELGTWIDTVTWDEITQRRNRAPEIARTVFDYSVIRPRFTSFIYDVLGQKRTDWTSQSLRAHGTEPEQSVKMGNRLTATEATAT
jgi:glycosyltransferase involved in cell wall biosynthesis